MQQEKTEDICSLEDNAAKSQNSFDMVIAEPVPSERCQTEDVTCKGVEVVASEEAQGSVLVLPEAGVEVDEGEDEGGEGKDGLNSSNRVQQVPDKAANEKNFPHLEYLKENQENT